MPAPLETRAAPLMRKTVDGRDRSWSSTVRHPPPKAAMTTIELNSFHKRFPGVLERRHIWYGSGNGHCICEVLHRPGCKVIQGFSRVFLAQRKAARMKPSAPLVWF